MLLWIIFAVSVSASVVTKMAADRLLHESVPLLGSFFSLTYTRNPGIAFGIRLPPAIQTLLILGALAFVLVLALRTARTAVQRIAFGLILGGAVANLLDRARDGLVTDFFHVANFPVFNVADSCITIGAALLLAEAVGIVRSARKSA